MGIETYGLGFLAGVLSILSPCVLPILPVVLGAAAGKHRFGAPALAVGLTVSFVGFGLFFATFGFALGLDGEWVRKAGGVILAVIGIVLLLPGLQSRLATAAGPAGRYFDSRINALGDSGLSGQFLTGLLLGMVWTPCVGPTLGAASMLAAQGEQLGDVATVMLAFGLGAGLPLAIVGLASREVLVRMRGRMLQAGQTGKFLLGVSLLVIGALVLTGLDKALETFLIGISPDWLTRLTTSI